MSCQYNQSNSQVQIEHLYMQIDCKDGEEKARKHGYGHGNYMNNFEEL